MARHVVGPAASFPPGSQARVQIGRRAIAIFNDAGRLFALRDVCPHQGAPLSSGVVLGQVSASGPGEYAYDGACKFVRCPWHGWEYNLETGESSYDPEHDRVRAYDVSVAPGADVQGDPVNPGELRGRRPGPYTAETFEVSVENDYIVVDV
jgi:nitrite reductase/ring-hydroxylating ferredoxin subunit